jgi:nitroimidazol reductase NimA-like FMN-containing flavoprotein (pyridoxamine 5'-phosphate oxidase superfamily)
MALAAGSGREKAVNMTVDARPNAVASPEHSEAAGWRQLLAAVSFGRLGVVDEEQPLIVVLNHALDGEDIVFRTREDSRIAQLTGDGRTVPAVFEVDSAYPSGRSGWSVIARGGLVCESNPERRRRVQSQITTWAKGERDVILCLRVQELTGNRVGPTDRPSDADA